MKKLLKKFNKKKTIFNLVTSLLSVCVSIALLITSLFAWYTANKQVQANGIVASSAADKQIYVSTTYDGTTSITNENLAAQGFSKKINLGINQNMMPVSSSDGNNFYIANRILYNGSAEEGIGAFTLLSDTTYYYEKTLYFVSAEASATEMFVNNISITKGTKGSNLYNAVRVSLTGDSTKIYRETSGNATPVVDTTATTADTSDVAGRISYSDDSFNFEVPANYVVVEITLRVWIEGTDVRCTNDYSGTDFKIKLDFDTYE